MNLVDVLERAFQAVVGGSGHAKAHAKAATEEASMLMGTVLSLTLTVIFSPRNSFFLIRPAIAAWLGSIVAVHRVIS